MNRCVCNLNLEDKECYQFSYNNSILKGFYKSDTGRFYYAGGFIHCVVVCEIIKLTVDDLIGEP